MSDATTPPDAPDPATPSGERPLDVPGDRPPRRLLDRAPSERLAASAAGSPASGAAVAPAGSTARALGYGIVAAAAGAAVHLVMATLLLWTSGLLVVATTLGIVVGLAVAVGGAGAVRARVRRSLAVALALAGLAAAIGLNWALSGMYLGPLDYLAQVYGALVPLQAALAVLGALAGSR